MLSRYTGCTVVSLTGQGHGRKNDAWGKLPCHNPLYEITFNILKMLFKRLFCFIANVKVADIGTLLKYSKSGLLIKLPLQQGQRAAVVWWIRFWFAEQ